MSVESKEKNQSVLESLTLPDPLELIGSDFQRIAIIGVGVIGGSIGLRLKAMDYPGVIVGYDQRDVLNEALELGAIDIGTGDISEAIQNADLIILSAPMEEILKVLPTILKSAKTGAIVTDTAGTKKELIDLTHKTQDKKAAYIGGHPLAGSNRQGIANADPELFSSAYYLLVPSGNVPPSALESLKWWVRMLGAYPIVLEAELHDQIVARTTHVPFLIALALSVWAADESKNKPLLQKLSTGNFQTLTSSAALPIEVWQGVIQSNSLEILSALKSFRNVLEHIEQEFEKNRLSHAWQQAHNFLRALHREKPGDWENQNELIVTAPDRPGTIARIAGLLAENDINIRDIAVLYLRERMGGTLRVVVATRGEAKRAIELLIQEGFGARFKE